MRKRWIGMAVAGVLALAFWSGILPQGRGDDAPQGDYLVLALSWTPSWCAATGAARGDARCTPGAGAGWLVHGLWPQHADGGWPEFCDTAHDAPDTALIGSMRDIMGSDGLARHQWRKHGTCWGGDPAGYFARTRAAFDTLSFPDSLRARGDDRQMTPEALLAEFRAANSGIGADMAVVTCRDGHAQEIRLCLSNDLAPRPCDDRLQARACRASRVTLPAKP